MPVMRIAVRDNLPVHPRNVRQSNAVRILLDVIIPGQGR